MKMWKKEKIESECKQNNMIMKICYVMCTIYIRNVESAQVFPVALTENFPARLSQKEHRHTGTTRGNQPTDRLMTTYYVGKYIYTF